MNPIWNRFLLFIAFATSIVNTYAQITVDFSSNTTAGCPNPLFVTLTDNSSSSAGTINQWSWEITGPTGFPTGMGSNDSYTTALDIPGLYTVTLTVWDNMGNTDQLILPDYIEVYDTPTITYSVTPIGGCVPLDVCFDGTINPSCGTLSSVTIDAGDGTLYNQEDFCHEYTIADVYDNIIVVAENSCGCITTQTLPDQVNVEPVPVIDFSTPQTFSCTAPHNVTITNQTTADPSATYTWIIPQDGFSIQSTDLTYSFGIGNYDVLLVAENPNGCVDTLRRTDYISVGDPNADFTQDTTETCAGGTIAFQDLSLGNPLSWLWEVPATGQQYFDQNPNISFSTQGVYDVKLTVTYIGGCVDSIRYSNLITVNPLPQSTMSLSDSIACSIPFSIQAQSTTAGAVSSGWSFPGGNPSTFNGAGPVTVEYTSYGSYSITLTDTLSTGCVSSSVKSLDIGPVVANFTSDEWRGCLPLTINFSDVSTSMVPITSYEWLLPGSDQGTSSDQNPSITYNTVGCYDVQLIVETALGCRDTILQEDFICVGTPPVNAFEFSPSLVCFDNDPVCFEFTGSGADSVFWDFGDNHNVIAPDTAIACHRYSDNLGLFTVSATPMFNGCPAPTLFYIDTVEVLGPIADMMDSVSCADKYTYYFTNISTQADSIFWTFGDTINGVLGTSTLDNPIFTFPDTGAYYAQIQAWNDSTGCVHQNTESIFVNVPDASFVADDSIGCAPFTVNFSNTSHFMFSGFNSTRWDWDADTSVTFVNADGFRGHNEPHTFTEPGIYSIAMRNMDYQGCMDTVVKENYIQVHGVVPGFSATPTNGCVPLTVQFTDTSEAPLTYIDSWSWHFGVPAVDDDTSSAMNPSYEYNQEGSYGVSLAVTDSFGCYDSLHIPNFIHVLDPVASFDVNRNFICSDQTVQVTDLSIGTGLSYDWQFPGGTPSSYTADNNPPPIIYASEGVYSITLTITDANNCTSDTTIDVNVLDVIADYSLDTSFTSCPNPPLQVAFTNLSVNNVDSNNVLWDFGDGSFSNLFSPSHLYNVSGEYPVTLIANSLSGCSDTVTLDTVVVQGPWGDIEVLSSNYGCPCVDIELAVKTLNTNNASVLAGDGRQIPITVTGLPGDTVYDTLSVTYCDIGDWRPGIFLNDGTCSYNRLGNDTIHIDSIQTDFDFDNFGVCDSGLVCFSDSSASAINGNNILGWRWDFGDPLATNDTSNVQNPCYYYSDTGTYDVQLITLNAFGCSDTLIKQVRVRQSPEARIGIDDTTGCLTLTSIFSDSSITDNSATIVAWQWDFGAFGTSVQQQETVTFNAIGQFPVRLTVTDDFGCTDSTSASVHVYDVPTIDAGQDVSFCRGDSAMLSGSGGLSYSWIPNIDLSNDTIANPYTSADVSRYYYVIGTDANGCSSADSAYVTVVDVTADFSATPTCLGDVASFSDHTVVLSDTIQSWSWNFDDPSSGINNTSSLQNPSHIFSSTGTYDVLLTVSAGTGCVDDTTIQYVVQNAPISSFITQNVCIGDTAFFDASASSGGGGNIIGWHWDFGDASTLSDTSDLENPYFIYSTPGVYNVCLTVESDMNCQGSTDDTCMLISVYEKPMAIMAIDTACFQSPNHFSDLSQEGSAPIQSWLWSFGQTPADTLSLSAPPSDAVFTYSSVGSYTVSLSIIDTNQCSHDTTAVAVVYDNPSADYMYNTLCQGIGNEFVSTSQAGSSGFNIVEYYWDFDEGAGSLPGNSTETYSFANSGVHNVELIVVDAFGCHDATTQVVDVLLAPVAVLQITDTQGCNDVDIGFQDASVVNTPTWVSLIDWDVNIDPGINDTVPLGGLLHGYPSGNDYLVMLVVIDENGCVDTTTEWVNINENPIADFEANPSCQGIPFTLSSTSVPGDGTILTYNWSINNTTMLSGENVSYTHPASETISVELHIIDDNGCESIIVDDVSVDALSDVQVASGDTICPDSLSLFVLSGASSYVWSPPIGVTQLSADSFLLSPSATTTYSVEGISANGFCPNDEETVHIVVVNKPELDVTADPNPILAGTESDIELDIIGLYDDVLWLDNLQTLTVLNDLQAVAFPQVPTTYNFLVEYSFEDKVCYIDSSVTIDIIDKCDNALIQLSNIFTPNNDNQNDYFVMRSEALSWINYFKIYDRWGNLLFELSNSEVLSDYVQWDGRNKSGKICNSGVYVYVYEVICTNNDVVQGSGNVTLIK